MTPSTAEDLIYIVYSRDGKRYGVLGDPVIRTGADRIPYERNSTIDWDPLLVRPISDLTGDKNDD